MAVRSFALAFVSLGVPAVTIQYVYELSRVCRSAKTPLNFHIELIFLKPSLCVISEDWIILNTAMIQHGIVGVSFSLLSLSASSIMTCNSPLSNCWPMVFKMAATRLVSMKPVLPWSNMAKAFFNTAKSKNPLIITHRAAALVSSGYLLWVFSSSASCCIHQQNMKIKTDTSFIYFIHFALWTED